MQKISSYLYPNRIQLLADLAGFTTEYTNVYQRTVKIYNGIDNVLEFDIKNADQKRIDLSTIDSIRLNVMDASGYKLAGSPYDITTLDQTTRKGLSTVTIPAIDLVGLTPQYFQFSVTGLKDGQDIIFYGDSRFGAVGKMELVGTALPIDRPLKTYDTYAGEIDLDGHVINHFSAMPVTFYETDKTLSVSVVVYMTGFIGTVWLEGVTDSTLSVESFRNSEIPNTRHEFVTANSTPYTFVTTIGHYKYLRVSFQGNDPLNPTGTVDKVELIL